MFLESRKLVFSNSKLMIIGCNLVLDIKFFSVIQFLAILVAKRRLNKLIK